jgi:hypothetical protein
MSCERAADSVTVEVTLAGPTVAFPCPAIPFQAVTDETREVAIAIRELNTHDEPYVTVGELAKYWSVGRKQIYRQIAVGTVRATKRGPTLLRIRTPEAIDFEERVCTLHLERREHRTTRPKHREGGGWRSTPLSASVVRAKPTCRIGQGFSRR